MRSSDEEGNEFCDFEIEATIVGYSHPCDLEDVPDAEQQ